VLAPYIEQVRGKDPRVGERLALQIWEDQKLIPNEQGEGGAHFDWWHALSPSCSQINPQLYQRSVSFLFSWAA
jgi:hypothetical protein